MPDIALLNPGTSFSDNHLRFPVVRDAVESVDQYDLPSVDLRRFLGLIIPTLADQEFLFRERARVRDFLDDGKVIIFSGQVFRAWLPGAQSFVPRNVSSFTDYSLRIVGSHPIFEGVRPEDLMFRRGVAGFFARGHHPLPPGAEVLLTLADDEPAVYLDRQTTRGAILVQAGSDILSYGNAESTAARIVPQLFAWIRRHASAQRRHEVPS